ncbi:OsmC family protein [Eudoraea chungangensis]|uniref:OsmC family protein n=1 Tax=Eudoraea chungangensis TaxID=1481905 RepID=UPI0023ED9AAA|nr:OsmC family protein [Eudoraea chungangensis]
MKEHQYQIDIEWTGNEGSGTQDYTSYSRAHAIHGVDKYQKILGSSDPAFRGDSSRYNPEDLFLSSLSSCHMLWYLHLCSIHKIVVTEYSDRATGIMTEVENGISKFTAVRLNPKVKITDPKRIKQANELHEKANSMCFIANSCNFKVEHSPLTELC